MGTPRPHVSRHVSGRAPRRGRRPRRPVSAHPRIPAYSRLSLRRGRRPRRPVSVHPRIPAHSRLSLRRGRRPRRPVFRSPIAAAPASCMYASGGHISFNSERNMEKNAAKNHFGFPFRPIVTAVQKGSAPDRLHSYPHCRSCVPRENFLLSRRTGEVLYILHTFIFCGPKGRTYLSQSAGKRHPLPRPAFERPNGHTPPTRISSCLRSRTP